MEDGFVADTCVAATILEQLSDGNLIHREVVKRRFIRRKDHDAVIV